MAGMRILLTHSAPFLKDDPGSFAGWSSRALGAIPKWPRPVVKASRNAGTFNSVNPVSCLNPDRNLDWSQRPNRRNARTFHPGAVRLKQDRALLPAVAGHRAAAVPPRAGTWRLGHAVTFLWLENLCEFKWQPCA